MRVILLDSCFKPVNKLNEDVFVGYMNPHPLQKKIKIRVNFNDDDINTVKNVFEKTTKY